MKFELIELKSIELESKYYNPKEKTYNHIEQEKLQFEFNQLKNKLGINEEDKLDNILVDSI